MIDFERRDLDRYRPPPSGFNYVLLAVLLADALVWIAIVLAVYKLTKPC